MVPSRIRVALVCGEAFWRQVGGAATRTTSLLAHLARHIDITIIFLGQARPDDTSRLLARGLRVPLLATGVAAEPDAASAIRTLHAVLEPGAFTACIIDRTRFAPMRAAIPPGTRALIDIHDLVSARTQSMARIGLTARLSMTAVEERAALDRFDTVIAIQPHEEAAVATMIGASRVLLAPHPVTLPRCAMRPAARIVGLVASPWAPNVDGFRWFADSVWPRVARRRLLFHVYGALCGAIGPQRDARIVLRGIVPSLEDIYRDIDIAVNPVRCGAGLKIKSVEALASGLPLVTTTEGMRGLEDGAGDAFLVADEPDAFAGHLRRLIEDPALRARVGAPAFAYAAARFTPERCYGTLLDHLLDTSGGPRPPILPG